MNTIYKVVAILGLVVCGSSWAVGPGSQYDNKNNCNANLVVTENRALKFGTFDATFGGIVTIDATAAGVTTPSGVTMLTYGQSAVFEVSVTPGYPGTCNWPLSITLPASYTLTNAGGQTMTVSNLTTSILSGTTVNIVDGSPLLIYVGGTVTVAAGQAGGAYSGSYTFTVSF